MRSCTGVPGTLESSYRDGGEYYGMHLAKNARQYMTAYRFPKIAAWHPNKNWRKELSRNYEFAKSAVNKEECMDLIEGILFEYALGSLDEITKETT